MDITYHYPPELLQLLVDTIPRLCRGKRDLLLFFKGAGVIRSNLVDLENKVTNDRNSITKYEITRTILERLNERGESALRERREVLKRVVEFEDFSTCWPADELEAKGLVAEIRRVINVKDSFTRMKIEREAERQKHIEKKWQKAKEEEEKQKQIESIKKDLFAMFSKNNPQERGLSIEDLFNRLFKLNDILVRESFQRIGDKGEGVIEQLDGVINLDGEIYLVEMKWLKNKAGPGDVSQHLVRVFTRGSSRGIFISATDLTDAAIKICKESLTKAVIIVCTIEEMVFLLEKQRDLKEFLKKKLEAAIVDKNPFYKII